MADDDLRAKRQAALEAKKKRLEELKARRSNRESGTTRGGPPSSGASVASTGSSSTDANKNLDNYIENLLKITAPVVGSGDASVAEDAATAATPAPESKDDTPVAAEGVVTKETGTGAEEGATDESAAAVVAPPAPVKTVETFAIGTQTEEDDFPPELTPSSDDENEEKSAAAPDEGEGTTEEDDDDKKDDSGAADASALPAPVKQLTPAEISSAISSPPFSTFLNSASKKVERLLGAPILADLLLDTDYTYTKDEADTATAASSTEQGYISSRHTYTCPQWTTSHRPIADLDFSPHHKELILTSYHTSPTFSSSAHPLPPPTATTPSSLLTPQPYETTNSDGLLLIYSLAMPTHPENVFTHSSPILTCRFHPTEPHLLLGGCHNGQMCVWDVRSGRLPVQRSRYYTASTAGGGAGGGANGGGGGASSGTTAASQHTYPIISLNIIENGRGVVTVSADDGKINLWSLENLRAPAETTCVLRDSVSSLAIAPESQAIIYGEESGGVGVILPPGGSGGSAAVVPPTSSRGQSRRVVRPWEDGHFGPVTGIAVRSSGKCSWDTKKDRGMQRGFLTGSAGLVLTCGVDWTTKLWAPAYGVEKPILNFLNPSYDYYSDVEWCPTHPSVFAAGSVNGTLSLWNLATSLDEPITGSDGLVVDLEDGEAADTAHSHKGINKLKWSSDGRRLAVAAGDQLHVLGLVEEISRGKEEDEMLMMEHLVSRGLITE
mmetsp:Transcript_20620/g.25498  ORF Transcript_20620/g.25498 Transcript_20620/m.25498 type:complete len:723 (+) Transcript_20620:83-2251(+)|eukprot:CAMPEP_0172508140 /NCGR_PEP_ID=MMETSP1066-20121228/209538_1 /TAXON_ID=671091 /ORGANISM="Coscinodiscus wailesii, Strain CCMP2513" /LENGTH=722 /DNA_ID=CAMNT_0013285979 /DNA_START=136 /DNA_END=2304 /DNA_ORIENTATION=+